MLNTIVFTLGVLLGFHLQPALLLFLRDFTIFSISSLLNEISNFGGLIWSIGVTLSLWKEDLKYLVISSFWAWELHKMS